MDRTMPLSIVLNEEFYKIPEVIFDPTIWSYNEWNEVLSNSKLRSLAVDSQKYMKTI